MKEEDVKQSFSASGEMAEWSNALDSKSSMRVTVSGVQIPLSPPKNPKIRIWKRKNTYQKFQNS